MVNPLPKTKKTSTWSAKRLGWSSKSYELFPHLDVLQNLILGPTKAQGRAKEEVIKEAEELLERGRSLGEET